MTELKEGFPLKGQERSEWYQINSFLLELGQTAEELGLSEKDAVQIGGTAIFYRAYQAFGPLAVANFRGTHDMDVISFNQGAMKRILDRLKSDGSSSVFDYSVGKSSSLPDKKSMYVNFGLNKNPGSSTGFELDVYESSTGDIRFNQRLMNSKRIILDPPESLSLQTLNPKRSRGLVGVPSLRDAFVIKMDVVDYSKSGLRPKDKHDILTTLAICGKSGYDFETLIDAMCTTSVADSLRPKVSALEDVFGTYYPRMTPDTRYNPLLPDPAQVRAALESTRKYKALL